MLRDDHRRALTLAEALSSRRGFEVIPPHSNIVLAHTPEASGDVLASLEENGVRGVAFGPRTIRLTLHRDISDNDLARAVQAVHALFPAA